MVRGGGGEKREKKEEREVQRSNKTTGYLAEGQRFRLRLPSNWLHTSLCKVLLPFLAPVVLAAMLETSLSPDVTLHRPSLSLLCRGIIVRSRSPEQNEVVVRAEADGQALLTEAKLLVSLRPALAELPLPSVQVVSLGQIVTEDVAAPDGVASLCRSVDALPELIQSYSSGVIGHLNKAPGRLPLSWPCPAACGAPTRILK
ncbi:hypothetical protein EYF80_007549 [Liparis tanakae]|uniref:Uncharacterized protein n=1 Tax=Liparis tanakae TaxID=230148 RepID=A0A4Z2IWP6_9TELE|nr:hypothetical protein EYF80_007549 [Liparis tanakae]